MKKVFNWNSKRGIYQDGGGYTPYHYMRSAKGKKAVEEMMKKPFTHQEAMDNLAKLKEQGKLFDISDELNEGEQQAKMLNNKHFKSFLKGRLILSIIENICKN